MYGKVAIFARCKNHKARDMRKAFFLLLALMMGMAVQAQDIEKTDKFTTGYINGTYVNKYKTID